MNETVLFSDSPGALPSSTMDDLETVLFDPEPPLSDYREAMELANREALTQLGEVILLSWYDRDREFESPQHAALHRQNSDLPGYMDYGIRKGARLMIDIHMGRFIFFYLPVTH
jgi:hypothetical protein